MEYRWEVEPNPYTDDYDYLVTNCDKTARDAILWSAEMNLWDGNQGKETMTVRINERSRIRMGHKPVGLGVRLRTYGSGIR